MHKGHIDLIQRAKQKRFERWLSFLVMTRTEDIRLASVCRSVSAISVKPSTTSSLVSVFKLDETGIPPYPEGWTPGLEALQALVAIKEVMKSSFSTFAEKGYAEELVVTGVGFPG